MERGEPGRGNPQSPPNPAQRPAMAQINVLEWNLHLTRVRAMLTARRRCAQADDAVQRGCPLQSNPPACASRCGCRRRFRASLGQLDGLARSAPATQRYQLQRVVATLELSAPEFHDGARPGA